MQKKVDVQEMERERRESIVSTNKIIKGIVRVNVAEDNQSESQEQKEFALSKKQKTREKNE